jgi:DNA topoisomerase VI subunit A
VINWRGKHISLEEEEEEEEEQQQHEKVVVEFIAVLRVIGEEAFRALLNKIPPTTGKVVGVTKVTKEGGRKMLKKEGRGRGGGLHARTALTMQLEE